MIAAVSIAIAVVIILIVGILAIRARRVDEIDSLETQLNKHLGRKDRVYEVSGGRYLFERDIRRTNRRNDSIEKDIQEAKKAEAAVQNHKQKAARTIPPAEKNVSYRQASITSNPTGTYRAGNSQRVGGSGYTGSGNKNGKKSGSRTGQIVLWSVLALIFFCIIVVNLTDTYSLRQNGYDTDYTEDATENDTEEFAFDGSGECRTYDAGIYADEYTELILVDIRENGFTLHYVNNSPEESSIYLQGVAFDDEAVDMYAYDDLTVAANSEADFFIEARFDSVEHSTVTLAASLSCDAYDVSYQRLNIVRESIGGAENREGFADRCMSVCEEERYNIGYYYEEENLYIVVENKTEETLTADFELRSDGNEDDFDWMYMTIPALSAGSDIIYLYEGSAPGKVVRLTGTVEEYYGSYSDDNGIEISFLLENE